jgi:phosphate-selective porin OprO/OprP
MVTESVVERRGAAASTIASGALASMGPRPRSAPPQGDAPPFVWVRLVSARQRPKITVRAGWLVPAAVQLIADEARAAGPETEIQIIVPLDSGDAAAARVRALCAGLAPDIKLTIDVQGETRSSRRPSARRTGWWDPSGRGSRDPRPGDTASAAERGSSSAPPVPPRDRRIRPRVSTRRRETTNPPDTNRPDDRRRAHTMEDDRMRSVPVRRVRKAGAILAGLLLALPSTTHAGDYRPARAPTVDERIEKLEQEIQQLKAERAGASDVVKKEDLDSALDSAFKKQKILAGWQDGFFLQSPSGDFKLKLRGYSQADYRFFPFDAGDTGNDSFFMRRVRPIFEGTVYKYFDFRIMPDFGGGNTVLQDAYMDVRYFPYASVRAGKFKEPISLERLQSGADLTFIERAISQNLAPNRDVGIMFYGDVADSTFTYQLGLFNGVANGSQSSDGDNQTDKDFAGRVFVQPFRSIDVPPLKGLGFGVAGGIGERTNESESSLTYKTAGRSNFYQYVSAANVTGRGQQYRFAPQAYYYVGPFGLMGEYLRTESHIKGTLGAAPSPITHPEADERNRGWFGQASYVLTGEDASYKTVVPIDSFDPWNGRWGAFEIAGRVSTVDINDGPIKAKLAKGSDNTWAYTGGLNWYLNKAFKVQLNYERANFSQHVTFGSTKRDHEDVLLTRFQIQF